MILIFFLSDNARRATDKVSVSWWEEWRGDCSAWKWRWYITASKASNFAHLVIFMCRLSGSLIRRLRGSVGFTMVSDSQMNLRSSVRICVRDLRTWICVSESRWTVSDSDCSVGFTLERFGFLMQCWIHVGFTFRLSIHISVSRFESWIQFAFRIQVAFRFLGSDLDLHFKLWHFRFS